MLTKRSRLIVLAGLAVLIVLIGSGFLVYRIVFLHFVKIPTGAMANTIIPGDHLIVKKRAFGEINRGDIIVFRYRKDDTYYVARVIGLPGETMQIKASSVFANGNELRERRVAVEDQHGYEALTEFEEEGDGNYSVYYSRDSTIASLRDDTPYATREPFTVPENMYFVMGDNRDNSADSRYRGAVPRELVFGKPTMIYWSESPDPTSQDPIRWNRIFKKIQ